MRYVLLWFMVNLSLVFSATLSEWDDGNIDMPEPFEFETVEDIMSYLESNYWKGTDFATATSKPLDDFNQVIYLSAKDSYLTTMISK